MFTHYMSTPPHTAHTVLCIFPEGTTCAVPVVVSSYVSGTYEYIND